MFLLFKNVKKAKQYIHHYPKYIRKLCKEAIAWKCWKITNLECDKCIYKSVAVKCSSAISKYHAAKELELICKNNVGSFYNYVNKKLSSLLLLSQIFAGQMVVCVLMMWTNVQCLMIFLQLFLLVIMAPTLICLLM